MPQTPTTEDPNSFEIDVDDDNDDTEIYFDDFGEPAGDEPQKSQNQSEDTNIEDEYYELDGF